MIRKQVVLKRSTQIKYFHIVQVQKNVGKLLLKSLIPRIQYAEFLVNNLELI